MAPRRAHFAQGWRPRASGSTPALRNSRIVRYCRARISWSSDMLLFLASTACHDRAQRAEGIVKASLFYLPTVGNRAEIEAGMAGLRPDLYQRMLREVSEQVRLADDLGYDS